MSKNYLILISIIFLVNCKTDDTSHEKKEVLPYNSITKLILSDNQVEFEKAQVSNLETVNGYRYLKFETNIDSLFYEDWYKETVSNDYTILQKRQDIYVNDENQNRKISLYFVGKNLAKINMSWSKEWDILRSGYSFEQILTTAFGNCTSRIWKDNIDTIIKAHNNSQTMFLPKHRTYLSRKNIYSYSTNFANADDLGIVYYITYCTVGLGGGGSDQHLGSELGLLL